MATQMQLARQGVITEAMKIVAEQEHVTAEFIREGVANGTIAIPCNINHKNIMALLDDLKNKINNYFTEKYEVEETTIVPSTDYSKLTFGNKGLTAELTFLFVDIRKSSQLHDTYGHIDAAKIYQSFHDLLDRNQEPSHS